MSNVIAELQPILTTTFVGIVIAYARYVHNLKERVAVLENSFDDLKQEMKNITENIKETIGNIQKRLDSHSKKYDAILERIGSMEREVLKETGSVKADISELKSDLRGFSNLILASDNGIKINRQ